MVIITKVHNPNYTHRSSLISHIRKNSTKKKLEVGDNHKDLKREKRPKYLDLEGDLLA